MMRRLLTALCLLVRCVVPLSADEATSVENPVYARWKNHPVGTEVRYRQHTQAQGVDERRLMVYRLTEKTADQLTVEIRTRQEGAAESDETVQMQTAKRLFRLPPGVTAKQFGKPAGRKAEGQEELEILGRRLQASWTLSEVRVEAGVTETKTWVSDQIPGGLVRSISTTPAVRSKTTMELLELRESALQKAEKP
ncbi:MAG: hypothetical protein ACKPJJ_09405 [Planctomycetaceae bacterium]